MVSEGSAFIDSSGELVASDPGFRRLLGLPEEDPVAGLRRRAAAEPALKAFLEGEGVGPLSLSAHGAGSPCRLSRVPCAAGQLLSVAAAPGALGAPALEYAVQALALSRLAGGIAHEVKNPLNAMALQLALLSDKIGAASESLLAACSGNLASLKNQVVRIDEVVRRYLDVADPSSAESFDAARLLDDAVTLFGHEARRRHVALGREMAATGTRASGDPVRAARLVLGLLSSALSATPDGGSLSARVTCGRGEVQVAVEHTRGADGAALAWVGEVLSAAAAELAGHLERAEGEDKVRVVLALPKEPQP